MLLPRPASLVRSPVLPCVEAPLGKSVVLLADAGGEKPTGAVVPLCCWRTRGAKNPGMPLELMCWEGVEGVEWRLVLRVLPVSTVCVCVCASGFHDFLPGLPVEPVWPHWRPQVRSPPIIAGPRCRPGVRPCIAPWPVRYALRPEPGSLPQDHPGSGLVAPWLLPGQLHGISAASLSSPCCPVCCVCIGAFTAGGARSSEAASTAYSIW